MYFPKKSSTFLATVIINPDLCEETMLRQSQTTLMRPLTTAHLAQTMTLLGLTNVELHEKIESELSSNPALELVEGRYCPTCHRQLLNSHFCPNCSLPKVTNSEEPIVFVSPRKISIMVHQAGHRRNPPMKITHRRTKICPLTSSDKSPPN